MSIRNPPPVVGRWYLRWDKNEIFEVVAHDTAARTVRLRDYDGTSEEVSEEVWAHMSLGVADPPTDWTGPLERVDEIDMEVAQPPNGVGSGHADR